MRNAFAVFFLYVANILASGTHVIAQDFEPINQGFEPVMMAYPDFAPYAYTADRHPAGIIVERTQALFEAAGYKIQMIEMPVARIVQAMKSGKVHFFPGAKGTTVLDDFSLFSDQVVFSIRLNLYAYGRDPVPPPDAFGSSTLIVIRGCNYAGLLGRLSEQNATLKIHTASNHSGAFAMLSAGRGSYVLDYERPAKQAMAKLGISLVNQRLVEERDVYYMVSKNAPDPERLLEVLNHGLSRQAGGHTEQTSSAGPP